MSEKNGAFIRAYIAELRADDGNGTDSRPKITGRAVVYNSSTDIGGYYEEVIARGALEGCDLDDVFFFVNHDTRKIPIARARRNNGNSTMRVTVDNDGLYFEMFPDVENNPEAAALYSSIKRGDMSGMSFRMWIAKEAWDRCDTDYPKRTIYKIRKIDEISAVNFPAYKATQVTARSLDNDERALDNAPEELRKALDNAKAEQQKKDLELVKEKYRNKFI